MSWSVSATGTPSEVRGQLSEQFKYPLAEKPAGIDDDGERETVQKKGETTMTFVILGVVFVLMAVSFIAGIAIEARYGKNKYVAELATAGESLLPATPAVTVPAVAAAAPAPAVVAPAVFTTPSA